MVWLYVLHERQELGRRAHRRAGSVAVDEKKAMRLPMSSNRASAA
jgi:hypothetical protein